MKVRSSDAAFLEARPAEVKSERRPIAAAAAALHCRRIKWLPHKTQRSGLP